ncbi:MAG: NUDIX domain-containing protein [Chloroflexota bacterium]|nr:NUDIX domain-containing protein [Chloroflexota bacterium]
MSRYVPDQHGKVWDVGAAGAVIQADKVLLVHRIYGKQVWALPGGFARQDELLDEAAVREVCEETGIQAEVLSLIGARTCYVDEGGAIFVIFRMRPVAGDLRPDGVEVDRAAYFSAEKVVALGDEEIFSLARTVALAALNGGEGLVETACPPRTGKDYRAFIVR